MRFENEVPKPVTPLHIVIENPLDLQFMKAVVASHVREHPSYTSDSFLGQLVKNLGM